MNGNLEMYNEYLQNIRSWGQGKRCVLSFIICYLKETVYFKLIMKNANNNDKNNM